MSNFLTAKINDKATVELCSILNVKPTKIADRYLVETDKGICFAFKNQFTKGIPSERVAAKITFIPSPDGKVQWVQSIDYEMPTNLATAIMNNMVVSLR